MKAETKEVILREAIPVVILAAACLMIFIMAPKEGNYWWSEASRNVLNGVFIHDLVSDRPVGDPVGWAFAYYRQFPALTIGFYPPLLHGILGVSFLIFGVSHVVAQSVVSSFLFVLCMALYAMLRRAVSRESGVAAVVLFLAGSELIIWSQQVMLEVPMMAFAALGCVYLLRYGDRERQTDLWLAAAFFLAAMYTKQTAAIPLSGAVAGFLVWRRDSLVRRELWTVAATAGFLLLPLAVMQVRLGAFNVTSITSRPDILVPQSFDLSSILWYGAHAVEMFGPFLMALAVLAPVVIMVRWREPIPTGLLSIHAGWLIISYVVLSTIALKETRHGLLLGVPLAILAAIALESMLRSRLLRRLVVVGSVVVMAFTVQSEPTPVISGYRDVAEAVVRLDGDGGRIMIVSNRDGPFILNLRMADPERRFSVVRADKLFLDIAVMPELGLNPRELSAEEVTRMVTNLGIEWVVAVPGLWAEAPVMAKVHELLGSAVFEEVARFPISGSAQEKEAVLYRNRAPRAPSEEVDINLRGVGIKL